MPAEPAAHEAARARPPTLRIQVSLLFRRTLMLLSVPMLGAGVALIVVAVPFVYSSARDVLLEIGVNLSLFGGSTLMVTVFATQQKTRRLASEVLSAGSQGTERGQRGCEAFQRRRDQAGADLSGAGDLPAMPVLICGRMPVRTPW